MAAIDKTLVTPRVVPGTAPATDDVSAPASPPPPGVVSPGTPDLKRFSAITGASAGAPRSILTRASVSGYNGPHEIGGVRFATTDGAMDQILVENGAERNLGILQTSYDQAFA